LGGPTVGFNFDGRCAADVLVGAIGADRWTVDIRGKASHAGVAPERGISASMVLALAMAEDYERGWCGKVVKESKQGTSNIGSIGTRYGCCAGGATNVVIEFVPLKG